MRTTVSPCSIRLSLSVHLPLQPPSRRRREATFATCHPDSKVPLLDAAKDVVTDTATGVMDYGVSSGETRHAQPVSVSPVVCVCVCVLGCRALKPALVQTLIVCSELNMPLHVGLLTLHLALALRWHTSLTKCIACFVTAPMFSCFTVTNMRDAAGYIFHSFMEAAGFTVGRARAYTGAAANLASSVSTSLLGLAGDTVSTAVAHWLTLWSMPGFM